MGSNISKLLDEFTQLYKGNQDEKLRLFLEYLTYVKTRIVMVADQHEIKPTDDEKKQYFEQLMKDLEFLSDSLRVFFQNDQIKQHLVNSLLATIKATSDEDTFREISDFFMTYQTAINQNEQEFFEKAKTLFVPQ